MSISLFQYFRFVAGGIAHGLSSHRRRKELSAALSGDHGAYLIEKSLHFAADHRALGYGISDKRVLEIIHSKGGFFCGNLSPYDFAQRSFKDAQTALISVRESIREELGIALPRMKKKELMNFKLESGL